MMAVASKAEGRREKGESLEKMRVFSLIPFAFSLVGDTSSATCYSP
jgi:hypothetical protein